MKRRQQRIGGRSVLQAAHAGDSQAWVSRGTKISIGEACGEGAKTERPRLLKAPFCLVRALGTILCTGLAISKHRTYHMSLWRDGPDRHNTLLPHAFPN